jgi:hypothetical protein
MISINLLTQIVNTSQLINFGTNLMVIYEKFQDSNSYYLLSC